MSVRAHSIRGFTLIEILVVVVILGILAAIVIPHFTSANDMARATNLTTQLKSIRDQLELAKMQHQDAYPDLVSATGANWITLTAETESTSAYGAGDASGDEVGPYLMEAPQNPFEKSISVAAAAAPGVGWVYDQASGDVKACVSDAKRTAMRLSSNEVATYP